MEALNLRKLQKKTREMKRLNKDRLLKTSEKLSGYQALDIKLTALDSLLESLLDGEPGLTQQLEAALKNLEELNLRDDIY